MPYDRNADLPQGVRDNLPRHAQTIYRSAFNDAFDQYKSPKKRRDDASREETAHKVAWNAVKQKYHKEGRSLGQGLSPRQASGLLKEAAPEAGPGGSVRREPRAQPPMQVSAVLGVQTSRPV
jgi:cation transport regulator